MGEIKEFQHFMKVEMRGLDHLSSSEATTKE